MAQTKTPNFQWTLADLGGDAANWGNVVNQTLTAIDSVVASNQTNIGLAGVPIGVALDFFGIIIPTNYLPCDGSTHNVSDFPILGAMLAVGAASTFVTPNYGGKVSIGTNATYALGTSGGSNTVTLTTAMLAPHAHPITDVTHTHTSPAHAHTSPAHTHGLSDPTHAHGGGFTQVFTSAGISTGAYVGNQGATGYAATGITIAAAAVTIAGAAVTITAAGTGLTTTQSAGGTAGVAQPVPIMQSWIACNKIIRAK